MEATWGHFYSCWHAEIPAQESEDSATTETTETTEDSGDTGTRPPEEDCGTESDEDLDGVEIGWDPLSSGASYSTTGI